MSLDMVEEKLGERGLGGAIKVLLQRTCSDRGEE